MKIGDATSLRGWTNAPLTILSCLSHSNWSVSKLLVWENHPYIATTNECLWNYHRGKHMWVSPFWPWTISMCVSATSNCHYLHLCLRAFSGPWILLCSYTWQEFRINEWWGVNGVMQQLPLSSEFPSKIKFQLLTMQICSIMYPLFSFISSCFTSPSPTSISWDHLPNLSWSFLGFENNEEWVSPYWVWILVHCLLYLN